MVTTLAITGTNTSKTDPASWVTFDEAIRAFTDGRVDSLKFKVDTLSVSIAGVLTAYDSRTGQRIYQQRVGSGGSFSASPVAAEGKIYISSEDGDVYVVKAGSQFELLASNSVGEILMATPAISDGILFFRGLRDVMAIKPAP